MRECLMLLVLLLLSPGQLWPAPLLTAEKQEHDFGEIIQGDKVQYVFRFQNAGDELLEIGQLRTSCGCTAALLSTRRVAPGTIGELEVVFESQGFRGEVQKNVTFETNDPQHPSVTFSLRGSVKVELFSEPPRVNWGTVAETVPLAAELAILNLSSHLIKLQAPRTTLEGVSAELDSQELAPGGQTELRVTAKFPMGKHRLSGYVIVDTDFSPVPQLKIPFSARLQQK